MITKKLLRANKLKLLALFGIFADVFWIQKTVAFLYLLLVIILICEIHKKKSDHRVLFAIALFFFFCIPFSLLFQLNSIVVEKFAIWFLVFALLALITRIIKTKSFRQPRGSVTIPKR